VTQYDSRLDPAVSGNFSEYHSSEVNRLIDRGLAEPDRGRRAAMRRAKADTATMLVRAIDVHPRNTASLAASQ